MIIALQDVPNLSVVNAPPVRDLAPLTGAVRPLPATPSAIVVLGTALQPPLTYNASGRLESQVALTTTAIALEPPFTPDIVAALSSTFNPLTPGTRGITPLITSAPILPTTLTGVIADTDPGLAGAPNTATFAVPPPIAAASPPAAEADAAITLTAGPTFTAGPATEGTAPEGAVTAAPLTPAAVTDPRIVTPEPAALTIPATARAEAVLTALSESRTNTVITAPNVFGAPATESTDALALTVPVAADAIAAPAATTTAAPSVAGATITRVQEAPTVPAQVPTAFLEAGILTSDDIVRNPFYPAMAATLYLSAMTFRLQQSSAAELNSPAENVQMVGGIRAVSAVDFDRQGPADDFRNMTRTFA